MSDKCITIVIQAVRIFAKQSVVEKAMPFRAYIPSDNVSKKREIGLANCKYNIPEDIINFSIGRIEKKAGIVKNEIK